MYGKEQRKTSSLPAWWRARGMSRKLITLLWIYDNTFVQFIFANLHDHALQACTSIMWRKREFKFLWTTHEKLSSASCCLSLCQLWMEEKHVVAWSLITADAPSCFLIYATAPRELTSQLSILVSWSRVQKRARGDDALRLKFSEVALLWSVSVSENRY